MIRLLCFLALTSINQTHGDIITDKGESTITCTGSLVLKKTNGEEVLFHSSQIPVNTYKNTNETVRILSARVEGCGCFYIFSSKNGKRASALIQSGQELNKDEIGFNRVKSLQPVICEKNAMPVWGVVIAVITLVALVGFIAVFVVRRLRNYQAVKQNPSQTSA